ncbi:hypothetical protein RR48_08167 [Papilio machaon]|uniref:Uncharacterized protein n=1 Tax=Papilio machaon TaxID=76193 RepID=A0A194RF04_PAPMA|nr:hypothetical protein RR48_08167 [Papilio machaon]
MYICKSKLEKHIGTWWDSNPGLQFKWKDERLMLQGKVERTRLRGKSPMRWIDEIKEVVAVSMHKCALKAEIREEWRRFLKRV